MKLLRFLTILIVMGTASCLAQAPAQPKTIRLLTVGNSFSHNATHYLGDLARAGGDNLVLREDNVGGANLELHWSKVQAFEANPADPLGLYSTHKSLRQELTSEKWDFVTIQQSSVKSHDLATYRPFARQLSDYIRQNAPGAALLLHETWEYRADDFRFSPAKSTSGEPKSQDEMYHGLANAYASIAKEIGVRLLPVGDAFHLANLDPQWGYHVPVAPFDSKKAKPGELPDQTHSLNVGWSWGQQADGTMKLTMDGHHANTAGEYLGACVWYEVIFGKSVENNPFVAPGLDTDYARFLRATAHRAVKESAGH